MSQTNLTFNKRPLTSADFSLLQSYGIKQPGMFAFAYELKPHGTTFSNPVTFQGRSTIYLKVPHPNQHSSASAEWVIGGSCEIDGFSIVYESPVIIELGTIYRYDDLSDFIVPASDNPRYTLNGITRSSADAVRALLEDSAEKYAEFHSPAALEVMDAISPLIDSTPFGTADSALYIDVKHPATSAGTSFGPNDRPIIIASIRQSYEPGNKPRPNFNVTSFQWPADLRHLGYYINDNNKFIKGDPSRIRLQNVFFQFLFRAMGWDPDILKNNFSFFLDLGGFPTDSRNYCIEEDIVKSYRDYIGDQNLLGVPMGYQPGTEHLFAGGFHADRFDTADFYFPADTTGGPFDQPIPHPALQGEILSTNSREGTTQDFYTYKRHKSLEEGYYKPNFIITKAAMKAIGYDIDFPQTNANALHAGPQELSVFNAPTSSKEITREFTEEDYLINNQAISSTISKKIMVDQNRNRSHGGCADCHDTSIKKALKYFGFIPFGVATANNVYPGSSTTAVVVENGKPKLGISGDKIVGDTRSFAFRRDFHIFISANSSHMHDHLYYTEGGPHILDQDILLKKYFNAKRVKTIIDVGDTQFDIEDERSFNSSFRHQRYVLIFEDTPEPEETE